MGQVMTTEIATLAGGCFWCLEAVYDQVKGVYSVESGYIGGQTDAPTYEQVCGDGPDMRKRCGSRSTHR